MDIRKREQVKKRESIAQRRMREFEEERESEEVNRQLSEECQTHLRLWILNLKLLFEIPRQAWTEDDKATAEIAFRNLRKARMKPCDAREERDRLLFLYEDYLKKTAPKIQAQDDEDEL